MVEVLLYVVIDERIHNYWFYGRELADVNFGNEEIGVALILNNYNQQIYASLLRLIPSMYGPCNLEHLKQVSPAKKTDCCRQEVNITPGECCGVAATEICPIHKSVLKVDAHLASCATTELQRSYKFRRRFLKYLRRHSPFTYQFQPSDGAFSEIFDGVLEVPYVVEIQPLYPVQKIDFAW